MMIRTACLALLTLPATAMAASWSGDASEYPPQALPDYGYLAQHASNAQPAQTRQEQVVRGGIELARVAAFFVTGQYALSPTLSLTYRTEPVEQDMVSRAEACGRLGLHYRF